MTELRNYFALNAQILYWIFVASLSGKPRFNLSQVFSQMVRIGVQALPMASLVAFSIGLTLAMQGAYQLSKFGATAYVPDLVSADAVARTRSVAGGGCCDWQERVGDHGRAWFNEGGGGDRGASRDGD